MRDECKRRDGFRRKRRARRRARAVGRRAGARQQFERRADDRRPRSRQERRHRDAVGGPGDFRQGDRRPLPLLQSRRPRRDDDRRFPDARHRLGRTGHQHRRARAGFAELPRLPHHDRRPAGHGRERAEGVRQGRRHHGAARRARRAARAAERQDLEGARRAEVGRQGRAGEGGDRHPRRLRRWQRLGTSPRAELDAEVELLLDPDLSCRAQLAVEHRYRPSVGETTGTEVGSTTIDPQEAKRYATLYCVDKDFVAGARKAQKPGASGSFAAPLFERRIAYVLASGADWAGPIGDFHLTIDKGKPDSLVSFSRRRGQEDRADDVRGPPRRISLRPAISMCLSCIGRQRTIDLAAPTYLAPRRKTRLIAIARAVKREP